MKAKIEPREMIAQNFLTAEALNDETNVFHHINEKQKAIALAHKKLSVEEKSVQEAEQIAEEMERDADYWSVVKTPEHKFYGMQR